MFLLQKVDAKFIQNLNRIFPVDVFGALLLLIILIKSLDLNLIDLCLDLFFNIVGLALILISLFDLPEFLLSFLLQIQYDILI